MKLKLLALLLLSGICHVMAQSGSKAFSKGDNLINVGIGLGSPFFGSGYSSSLPINPSVSFEHGVSDEISVGAQLSYASSKYNYSNYLGYAYNFKASGTYIGARGSYHLNEALDIDSKFDVYGGASLGYVIVSYSDNLGSSVSSGSGFGYGAFAGGKYYFKPKLGVYAEIGYQSLSFLNVGIAFKL